ncbi:hypothetical protein FOL47_001543 [Perkinsus chesapeaki]|uniref:Uncharacterized protein n=1 Tax=Perkinsus chesapeaki TaxID=330153 RepID=A0A7J6KSW5_PERCH|nr:hypothetical protein FOL47_001543 [Perkinsus chesapeaki]
MPPYIGSAAAPCDISPLSMNDMSRHNDEDENPEQDLVADLSPNGPPSTRRAARRTPRERPSIAQSLDFTAAVMPVVPDDDMTLDERAQADEAVEDSNSSHSEIGLAIDMQEVSRVLESGSNVDSQEDNERYDFSMDT